MSARKGFRAKAEAQQRGRGVIYLNEDKRASPFSSLPLGALELYAKPESESADQFRGYEE